MVVEIRIVLLKSRDNVFIIWGIFLLLIGKFIIFCYGYYIS